MKNMKSKAFIALTLMTVSITVHAQGSGQKTPPKSAKVVVEPGSGWFQPFWDLFNW